MCTDGSHNKYLSVISSDDIALIQTKGYVWWSFPSKPFLKQALVFTCLLHKTLENTVGKGEIARNEQFLLFPQRFLAFSRTSRHFPQIQNCRLQPLSLWKRLKLVVWEKVNPFQNKPWFYVSAVQVFWKRCGEKEKLLILSNFSFSHSVFNHMEKFLPFSSNLKL